MQIGSSRNWAYGLPGAPPGQGLAAHAPAWRAPGGIGRIGIGVEEIDIGRDRVLLQRRGVSLVDRIVAKRRARRFDWVSSATAGGGAPGARANSVRPGASFNSSQGTSAPLVCSDTLSRVRAKASSTGRLFRDRRIRIMAYEGFGEKNYKELNDYGDMLSKDAGPESKVRHRRIAVQTRPSSEEEGIIPRAGVDRYSTQLPYNIKSLINTLPGKEGQPAVDNTKAINLEGYQASVALADKGEPGARAAKILKDAFEYVKPQKEDKVYPIIRNGIKMTSTAANMGPGNKYMIRSSWRLTKGRKILQSHINQLGRLKMA